MPTAPRISLPGTIIKSTQAVTTREFWLRPDPGLSQTVLFLLAVWSRRHSIEVHLATVLSNHLHLLVTDVLGDQIQGFNLNFFSEFTRAVNVYRNRKRNLLDPAGVNCVDVCPRAEDLIDHGTYVSLNAVEAGLVAKASKWPGINFRPSQMGELTLEIERPPWFFDPCGSYPETATLELTIPRAIDCDQDELRERMTAEHKRREDAKRQSMADAGETFLGRKRILRQSLRSRPKEEPEAFERIPNVACKDSSLRRRMLEWRADRYDRYRESLRKVRNGIEGVVFPVGTWFQHFYCGREREAYSGSMWIALMSDP